MGGLMSVTGLPDTEPTRVGIPVSDLAAGLHLAIGILVALHERERTGVGRWVRTSLLETMISMMDLQAARFTVDGEVPKQEGNHHPTLVPMGCFASKDGYVNVAGPSGRLLHRFCDAIGRPDLPTDPRFDSGAKRSANRAELNAIVSAALLERTTAEWVDVLNDAGVPCGPVYGMDDVFADAQVRHLDMVALDVIRNPVSMEGVTTVRTVAPTAMTPIAEILEEWDADRH
jgi:crotonobetainyl-CoA:carnitine CoA-transferase CaiB-like acyl-CoA transferase